MTTRTAQGTIWVCSDCLFKAAYDVDRDDRPATEPEVWGLWADDEAYEVTPGMGWDAHSCGQTTGMDGDECECETVTFSTYSCDGCGSDLAGERHAFTYWG